jgi:UMP-CMP kinase
MSENTTEPKTSASQTSVETVFVLGCPAAGKGTICSRLAREFGWYHLSVGGYPRSLKDDNAEATDDACGGMPLAELQAHLKANKLIPASTIAAIVKHKIKPEMKAEQTRFLIDGYPRQVQSAELFEQHFGVPAKVFLFSCTQEKAKQRFLRRKRGADDEKVFEWRYEEFKRNNTAIISRYHNRFVAVDVDGDVEEAYWNAAKAFEDALGMVSE